MEMAADERVAAVMAAFEPMPQELGAYRDDPEKDSYRLYSYQLLLERKAGIDARVYGGLSKMAVVIDDLPYVIKVPYTGSYRTVERANNYVFVPLEHGAGLNHSDYLCAEAMIYSYAQHEGVGHFFSPVKKIGEFSNGIPCYLQEKAVIQDDVVDRPRVSAFSADEARRLSSQYDTGLDEEWLANAIEIYGAEDVNNLIKFISKYEINDLHSGNYGYRVSDGMPTIIDYAPWEESFEFSLDKSVEA